MQHLWCKEKAAEQVAQGVVDGTPKWVSCAKGYLLPVKVLSRVFRGKYLEGVCEAFEEGKLKWPRHVNGSMDADGLRKWLGPLYRKEWVVYSKRPWVRSLRGARNQRNGYMILYLPRRGCMPQPRVALRAPWVR